MPLYCYFKIYFVFLSLKLVQHFYKNDFCTQDMTCLYFKHYLRNKIYNRVDECKINNLNISNNCTTQKLFLYVWQILSIYKILLIKTSIDNFYLMI